MARTIEARDASIKAIHEQITGGKVGEFSIELISTIAPIFTRWVANDVGRMSTGRAVEGRDTAEDIEIGIDGAAENYIVKLIANKLSPKFGLSFQVLSEHNNANIIFDEGKPENERVPALLIVLDPFENSHEYQHRLPTPPFTHFQIYNSKNKPLAAGASNLSNGEMYLAIHGNNYRYNPHIDRLEPLGKPNEIRSIKEGNVVIASYGEKPKYGVPFNMLFGKLVEDTSSRGGSRHSKGGSHSYIDIATGAAGAYLMFNEPRGEVDPASLFALNAGGKVVSVDLQTGEYEDYKFDPDKQYERIPLLIAARSEELIKEIIEYYSIAKEDWETRRRDELIGIYHDYSTRTDHDQVAVAKVLETIFPWLVNKESDEDVESASHVPEESLT